MVHLWLTKNKNKIYLQIHFRSKGVLVFKWWIATTSNRTNVFECAFDCSVRLIVIMIMIDWLWLIMVVIVIVYLNWIEWLILILKVGYCLRCKLVIELLFCSFDDISTLYFCFCFRVQQIRIRRLLVARVSKWYDIVFDYLMVNNKKLWFFFKKIEWSLFVGCKWFILYFCIL